MAHNNKPIGIYCRLSRDKSEEGNYSISIENQQNIIKRYAAENAIALHGDIYVDDGFTGMNFNRPGFMSLLEDCRAGKLGGIIVKDMSRLGRKLYQTLTYTQEVFPAEGIRLISIQENYDSNNPETSHTGLLLSATGMINEQHCIITSLKTSEALRSRAREGKFIGSKAPFGYSIDPADKYHLVVDPVAAEVVKRIFDLACQGHGYKSISGIMRRDGVLNPTAYVNKVNPKHHENSEYWRKPHDWHATSVSTMLNNPAYLGHMFYGRRGKVALRVDKVEHKDEDSWIKVYDTHEPIVAQETWDLAHELLSRRTVSYDCTPKHIFAGLLKCSDCGYTMSFCSRAYSKNRYAKDFSGDYRCSTYHAKGKNFCSIHYITYNDLYAVVLGEVRAYAALAVKKRDWLIRELNKSAGSKSETKQKNDKSKLAQIAKDILKLEKRVDTIYNDRIDGTLPEERSKQMIRETTERIDALKQEQSLLTEELAKIEESSSKAKDFADIISEYENIEQLDAAILNRLIERIAIGNKVHLGGKNYSQDITIHFRFVGAVGITDKTDSVSKSE